MAVLRGRVFWEFGSRKGSEGSLSSILSLQKKKLRFREGKEFAPGHSARQGQAPGSQLTKPGHGISGQAPWTPAIRPGPLSGEGWGRGEERVTEYHPPIGDRANRSAQLNLEC